MEEDNREKQTEENESRDLTEQTEQQGPAEEQKTQPQSESVPKAAPAYDPYQYRKPVKKQKTSIIPIIAIVVAILFSFVTIFGLLMRAVSAPLFGTGSRRSQDTISYSSPYIGVLSVNGTIQGDTNDTFSTQSYHHSWTVRKLKELKNDKNNRGLIVCVNTPGGGVYESDELYLAIKDYKETTGRPVYSYMMSQATSGGYYISAPCDKIYANRNCWTGSIGVTIGTLYDISGLLKKYGVKTVTITSGKNKAMGSSTDEMTEEQREIFQSLVDEAYDQFVGIVSEGRGMSEKEVRKIADGRVYTAKQAKEIGLVDEVATYEEALSDMKKRFELESCNVNNIEYQEDDSILGRLLRSMNSLADSRADSELDSLKALMDRNGKFTVAYLSEVEK